jgi:hypothetical protein
VAQFGLVEITRTINQVNLSCWLNRSISHHFPQLGNKWIGANVKQNGLVEIGAIN